MSISRRTILQLAATPFALTALRAFGQTNWPHGQPIRIVVGYPPGQTADHNARLFAQVISKALGQSVVVFNVPGANGMLGAREVQRSKADGYTLLWGGSGPLAINPSLYKNISYDPIKDFAPVCLTTKGPLYLIANLSFPCNNVQELIDYAKAHPDQLDYGTAGNGSTAHLAMKMFEASVGVDFSHIPYKGSQTALNDLMGGQIPLMFEAGTSATPLIAAGKVKALGVSSAQRSPNFPDLPTIQEQGVKDFEAIAWNGIVVPAGTPEAIIETISNAVSQALSDPATADGLRATGSQVAWMGPSDFSAFLGSEIRKWGKVIELSGAQIG